MGQTGSGVCPQRKVDMRARGTKNRYNFTLQPASLFRGGKQFFFVRSNRFRLLYFAFFSLQYSRFPYF